MKLFKSNLIAGSLLLTTAMTLASCENAPAPDPILPVPTQAQIEWQKMETYAFVHFGINTFNDMEWGFGNSPIETFNPTDLDVNQWAKTLKAAGMKAIMLTVKHHDGFCLWQTKYSEYSVGQLEGKDIDMLRDLIAACKKYDLKMGIYISPWDRNHAEYGNEKYVEYFHNQIREVIEEYCNDIELFEFWFDGANGGDGYYGGKGGSRTIDASKYYGYEKAADIIHSKFPNAMIFGGTVPTIRWIGNEAGWAGETNWAMWNSKAPESNQLMYGDINGTEWIPGEVDVSVRPGWFYHHREDHQLRSLSTLIDYYYQSVGRNANLILNFPVEHSGRIPKSDSIRIMEWRAMLDKQFANNIAPLAEVEASNCRGRGYEARNITDNNWDTYWATQDGVLDGELSFKFDDIQQINTILLQEYINLGQRVADFEIEYKNKEGKIVPIETEEETTTIGYKRIVRFENIETKELIVKFKQSRGVLCINNIELYSAPKVLDAPSIIRAKDDRVQISAAKGVEIYYTTNGDEPTTSSTRYSEEGFVFEGKGTIKAIAYDAVSKNSSTIGSVNFDISRAKFNVIVPKNAKNSDAVFDGNRLTALYLQSDQNVLEVDLGGTFNITGIAYTPDQNRWGGGAIHRYRVCVDGKIVKEGEFSNIRNNPLTQQISFEVSKGSKVRLEALSIADNSDKASVSEFEVFTSL